MSLWRWYAGNLPAGVVVAWTAVVLVGWPLMLVATAAEKVRTRWGMLRP